MIHGEYGIRDLKQFIYKELCDLPQNTRIITQNSKHVIAATKNDVYVFTGEKAKKILGFKESITKMACDESLLYIALSNGEIKIVTYKKVVISKILMEDEILVDFCRFNGYFVILCDHKICFYDLQKDEMIYTIEVDAVVKGYSICNDTLYVLVGCQVYVFEDFELKPTQFVFSEELNCFKMHATANGMISVGFTKTKIFCFSDVEKSKVAHYKKITDMHVSDDCLYTISEDMHIKAHDFNLKCMSSINTNVCLVKMVFINNQMHLCCKEKIFVKAEVKEEEKQVENKRYKKLHEYDEDLDVAVTSHAFKKNSEIEKLLIKYKYVDAVELAFDQNSIPDLYQIVKVLKEKRELKKLFTQGNKEFIEIFMAFVADYFYVVEFQDIFVECLTIITALYKNMLQSDEFIDLLQMINDVVNEELIFAEYQARTIAFLEEFE